MASPPLLQIPDFVRRQWITPQIPSGTTFKDQAVVITGANCGLGLEAARHVVRLHAAKVILAVRCSEKGEEAKRDIESTTGIQKCHSSLAIGSKKSWKRERLRKKNPRISEAGCAFAECWHCYRQMEACRRSREYNYHERYQHPLAGTSLASKLREAAVRVNKKTHLTIISSDVQSYCKFQEREADHIFETLQT